MAAYDTPLNMPVSRRSRAAARLSEMLGHKPEVSLPEPVAPAPDYALTPDQHGRITLAGNKVPLALALIGAGVVAVLLINRRTRGPVLAAATTAWGFLAKKA
jgi:hypothetical protein